MNNNLHIILVLNVLFLHTIWCVPTTENNDTFVINTYITTFQTSIGLKNKVHNTPRCPPDFVGLPAISACLLDVVRSLSWFEAAQLCSYYGGRLVQPTEFQKHLIVVGYINSNSALRGQRVWIGLNDLAREGAWTWSPPGTRVKFTKWAPGQPNNDGGEECAFLEPPHGYAWHDIECHHKIRAICERPMKNI